MASQSCAVIGIGQTKHKKQRDDVSLPGLVREAAQRALDDAGMTWTDIDAVVLGKAPDPFEGVMMPELSMADALGATGKPMMRVHTAGSVGGSTALVATHLVQTGVHDRVLTVAYEKQAEGNAQWGLAGGQAAAAWARAASSPRGCATYIQQSGAPEDIGWKVAVKDRQNALKNPYAHLQLKDISSREGEGVPDAVGPDPLPRVVPVVGRRVRDGAHERRRREEGADAAGVGARHRDAQRARQFPGRDTVRPQAGVECAHMVYDAAGITNPREQIDIAELYVPFSWYEPMWLEGHDIAGPGEGWRMVEDGSDARSTATSR